MQKGYTDTNGQYVPKKPNFKLKDKPNHDLGNLDTINIYKHYQSYYQGKRHPSPDDEYSRLNKIVNYLKFYQKGRCLDIVIKAKDELGNISQLKEIDLSPNNLSNSKEYYYSKNGREIVKESFVYGEGYGTYVTLKFMLNSKGDTLTFDDGKGSKSIYVKEILPKKWGKYRVDW